MSLYKREGSPFWQYTFSIGGIRFRGSTGCTGKREASAVEAKERHEAKAKVKRSGPWAVRDCFAAYWNDHGRHKAAREEIWVKLCAMSDVFGPDKMIENLTNSDLMDYRAARQKAGLQPQTVNRDLAYLKASLRHANQMHGKQIPAIAWKRVMVKEPHHRIRFLSHAEYHELLEYCSDDLALIVKVAVATGLRKANILNLEWREVDLSSGMITVTVKGDKTHTVRMPSPIRAALSTLPHREGLVFNTTNFRRQWERAVMLAGLQDFRFHDLRHTCASWMRMAGVDLADICEALGHSSVTVTMRYAHIEPTTHVSAFDRISAQVWSQKESHQKGKSLQNKG